MNECVVPAKDVGSCGYCGDEAHYISLTFMCHICSVECEDSFCDEYMEATYEPENFKKALEAYHRVREILERERLERTKLAKEVKKYGRTDQLNERVNGEV